MKDSVLLVADPVCDKILWKCKIWAGLSGNFLLVSTLFIMLRVFKHYFFLAQEETFYQKQHHNVSNVGF